MKTAISAVILFFLIFVLAINDLNAEWDVQRYPGLAPEVRDKLKELKEGGDLKGIVALWERTNGDSEYTVISRACFEALLSFSRERFIPILRENMLNRNRSIADRCMGTLLQFRDPQAIEAFFRKITISPLTADQERRAKELVETLKSDDAAKREAAAGELTAMGAGVIRLLLPLTKDSDKQAADAANGIISKVRLEITYRDAERLRILGGERALSALRTFVKDEHYGRDIAMMAISQLTQDATPEDAALICDYLRADDGLDSLCIRARLKDPTAVAPLIKILEEGHAKCDPPSSSRGLCRVVRVAGALGNIGDKRAIEPLEKALNAEIKDAGPLSEFHRERAENEIIAALARCGQMKRLYDKIENAAPDKLRIIYLCGLDDLEIVLKQIPRINDRDTLGDFASWLNRYVKEPNEKLAATIRDKRASLAAIKSNNQLAEERISVFLIRHGDAQEKEDIIKQTKSDDPLTRYRALWILSISMLIDESLLSLFVEACDDKGTFIPPESGSGWKFEVRKAAIDAVQRISGEPLYLWDFDPDRQVAEVKAWYKKYLEKKAAEKKTPE